MGWPVDDQRDDVFLIPLNVAEVRADGRGVRTFVPASDARVQDRRAAALNGNHQEVPA
jgi:hypothetical protein